MDEEGGDDDEDEHALHDAGGAGALHEPHDEENNHPDDRQFERGREGVVGSEPLPEILYPGQGEQGETPYARARECTTGASGAGCSPSERAR
ncbi:MAG: hypothetical protein AMXMBFR77_27140 [Phycisphaerales bacterium]|nr:MAG: hypothetical protein BroJett004_26980 [Planctomycetota bacterium]